MEKVKCCYSCRYICQLETNLMWECNMTGEPVNPDNICEKYLYRPERYCDNCANNLGNGVCTGDEVHHWIDLTGEFKCWKEREI